MLSIKLSDLANKLNAKVYGNSKIIINRIASIEKANAGEITFFANMKYRKKLLKCKASAIIITKENLPFCKNFSALVVNNPYLAYARTAQIMNNTPEPNLKKNIDKRAIIEPNVSLGKRVSIGANSILKSGVVLEDDVMIGPGCFIGQNVIIGYNSCLWANVTVYHNTIIGNHCLIQSGTIIGSDGFGYVNDCGNWIKIPQLGRVIIRNGVKIGACTTIDRGALDNTIIGDGVIIDNQCQIAHNVNIGSNTAIAGGTVIAGSSIIGSECMIGGASVINGHINICNKVTITGMSMVMRSIKKPGIYSSGIPVQPNKEWRKTTLLVMKIKDIDKKIKTIEKNYQINKHHKLEK